MTRVRYMESTPRGILLRSAEDVEAYYWARRCAILLGLVAALIGLGLAALVAVTGGPLWATAGFTATAVPNTAIAAGWLPRRYRPILDSSGPRP